MTIKLDPQKGLSVPSLTTTEKNNIVSPEEGAVVFDIDLGKLFIYVSNQWNPISSVSFYSVTILGSNSTSEWSQSTTSDPWIATKTVNGILSSDQPIFDVNLSNVSFANIEAYQSDWGKIYRGETFDDQIKLYALEEPIEDLEITIKVVR